MKFSIVKRLNDTHWPSQELMLVKLFDLIPDFENKIIFEISLENQKHHVSSEMNLKWFICITCLKARFSIPGKVMCCGHC